MPRAVLWVSLLVSSLCAAPARAEGGAYRLFVSGASPGEPSTGKQVTAYSLYGASALGLIVGGYFFVDWSRIEGEQDDFLQNEPHPCADAGSRACGDFIRLGEEGNRSLNLALGSVATGFTLALSGVVLAEYWPNVDVEPGIALGPSGGFASATLRF